MDGHLYELEKENAEEAHICGEISSLVQHMWTVLRTVDYPWLDFVVTIMLMKRPFAVLRLGPRRAYCKPDVGIVNTYCLSKGWPYKNLGCCSKWDNGPQYGRGLKKKALRSNLTVLNLFAMLQILTLPKKKPKAKPHTQLFLNIYFHDKA